MPRSRATLTAPIVLAIVLIGVFAIRSRGAESPELTNQRQNCAPVARADVVATAPGVPIDVDVLANDTDADGDPLVFQIVQASGGTAVVVDGDTPLDGSDDRVRFTPAIPPVPQASFSYRAVDPDGAFGASLATVFVNNEKLPPAGLQSDDIDSNAGACGAPSLTETTFAPDSPDGDIPGGVDAGGSGPRVSTNSGSRPRTTATTATPRGGTTTTRPTPNTTPPSFPPWPPTSRPPSSQPPPTNPPPSDPDDCGPPPTSGSDAEEEAYERCLRGG